MSGPLEKSTTTFLIKGFDIETGEQTMIRVEADSGKAAKREAKQFITKPRIIWNEVRDRKN